MEMIEALRADAAKVLADGRAKVVIGYQARGEHRAPVFITNPERVSALVYDEACKQNLAVYLRKPEVKLLGKAAVVAPPAVMRSLVLLASESQLTDAAALALAVGTNEYHGAMDLAGVAALLKEKYADLAPSAELLKEIERLSALSPEERAAF